MTYPSYASKLLTKAWHGLVDEAECTVVSKHITTHWHVVIRIFCARKTLHVRRA